MLTNKVIHRGAPLLKSLFIRSFYHILTSLLTYFPFDIKAAGKNFKLGRGEGNEKFWEEYQDFKAMGMGKNIKLVGTIYTPGVKYMLFPLQELEVIVKKRLEKDGMVGMAVAGY